MSLVDVFGGSRKIEMAGALVPILGHCAAVVCSSSIDGSGHNDDWGVKSGSTT